LEKNIDQVDWSAVGWNPNAIHLVQTLDYEKTKEANVAFRSELLERVFDPDRMMRLAKGMPLRDYLSLY
jgi:hypothetical protein